MTDFVMVGRLGAPHGIKGWVKLRSLTQPDTAIFDYQPWFIQGASGEWQPFKIMSYQQQGKGYLVQPAGCLDRNQAHTYQGCWIGVADSQLPALDAGEYYWRDLTGLAVWTSQGEWLGVVDHLLETGSNDVLVVKPSEGSLDQRERLIPYLRDSVIIQVDLVARKILVDWDVDF